MNSKTTGRFTLCIDEAIIKSMGKLRILRVLLFAGLVAIGLISIAARAADSDIVVLRVKGTVNPVLVDYIKRGVEQAESDNAVACIVQLDTPGGLDTAMRDIVQEMLNAEVPVVVYVSPSGARAASAGTFITIAAHVAAMAPNTVIGAASPVALGDQEIPDTEQQKIINDAAAYIRSLAEARGRNADWAEDAVREAVSATEQEALQLGVIDIVAPNLDALISQLDGRQVTLLGGTVVNLQTQGANIRTVEMNTIEKFLYTIADPNIAYILLSVGMLGIMVEIFSPGLVFPGVVGGVCLALAFYALGVLSANIAGILLIVLAFGLFVAEAFTPGIGALAAGGIAALVIGSLILFEGGVPFIRVAPGLIATVVVLIAGFLVFVIWRVVKVHRRRAITGREELIGKTASVREALKPEGMVFLDGERWTAVSQSGPVELGEEVVVTKVEGLKLYVAKKQEEGK